MNSNDRQLLTEIDRTLADPNFNPAPPKGLKANESKVTFITRPDGSVTRHWGHLTIGPIGAISRKDGLDATTLTIEHVIVADTYQRDWSKVTKRLGTFKVVMDPTGHWPRSLTKI